jgi:hypothetical protein
VRADGGADGEWGARVDRAALSLSLSQPTHARVTRTLADACEGWVGCAWACPHSTAAGAWSRARERVCVAGRAGSPPREQSVGKERNAPHTAVAGDRCFSLSSSLSAVSCRSVPLPHAACAPPGSTGYTLAGRACGRVCTRGRPPCTLAAVMATDRKRRVSYFYDGEGGSAGRRARTHAGRMGHTAGGARWGGGAEAVGRARETRTSAVFFASPPARLPALPLSQPRPPLLSLSPPPSQPTLGPSTTAPTTP